MFGALKKAAMRLMFAKQLKGVPPAAREAMLTAIDKHPEFFKKIAKEIDARVKSGQDKMFATQAVVMQYRAELQKLFQK